MDAILRRERLIVGGCLAAIVSAAWWYLFHLNATMPPMDMAGMAMPEPQEWGNAAALLLFVMWAVMMVAMMVPSAAPMILTFLTVNRQRKCAPRPLVPVGWFLLGYIAVWTSYSALATLAQWELHKAALLTEAMAVASPALSGGVLIVAGVFQWTPFKWTCLNSCRSPLSFLMAHWREGPAGALAMGVRHGSYCVGCCWILMAILFVAGVMNLLSVAAIGLFVLAEKMLPRVELLRYISGIALAGAGAAHMFRLW